jgi:putative tryptophan/tyrosine transport system substrate-binding protein
VADPVAEGFVKSLSQPGGNITGIVGTSDALITKEIELFKELYPRLRRLLVVHNPDDLRSAMFLPDVHKLAEVLKLRVVERTPKNNHSEVEQAFASIKRGDVDGALVLPGSHRAGSMSLLLRLTSERHIPMAVHRREWVEEGGLFSYGPDYGNVGRDAARYIDKIFKGTKPADLPVEQSMRFEFVINLKTAKQMGLTIPPNVLARADKVIK